jgi:hypothetical protein
MTDSGLTLVLFGYLCRPQSASLLAFWLGFIELQRTLPSEKRVEKIVTHTWNIELADLAEHVYGTQTNHHQNQRYFYPKVLNRSEIFDSSAANVVGGPTLSTASIQNLLADAQSRTRAIQLLDESSTLPEQLLCVRWDLRRADDSKANRIVIDASLPEEYIYLSYSSNVDEGYDDTWIIAPIYLARRLREFDSFLMASLSGKNQFLNLFTKQGWPRARVKSSWQNILSHSICQKLAEVSLNISQVIWCRFQGGGFIHRVVRKMLGPIYRYLERPPLTVENSCLPSFGYKRPVFPYSKAVRNSSLFKYFILSEGLRNRVRFLVDGDFEVAASSGQVICPQKVVLFVWQAEPITILSLKSQSLLPLAAIYNLGSQQVFEYLLDDHGRWNINVLEPESSALEDRLSCGLSAAARASLDKVPVLITPSIEEYLACSDWYYLNALVKYISWRDLGYVCLVNQGCGMPHPEFPNLQIVERGECPLSLRLAAGTISGIQEFLKVANYDLRNRSSMVATALLEFPVLAKEKKLF